MRLEQYRKKCPEHMVSVAYLRENGTDQEVSQAYNMGSQGAKYLSSIGIPVAQLGTVIKDEDLLEEEELSSKDLQLTSAQEQSEGFKLWPTDTWKTVWKNILERLRFTGKKLNTVFVSLFIIFFTILWCILLCRIFFYCGRFKILCNVIMHIFTAYELQTLLFTCYCSLFISQLFRHTHLILNLFKLQYWSL